MGPTIREKLSRIYGPNVAENPLRDRLQRMPARSQSTSLAAYLGGDWLGEEILCVRRAWPADHVHGGLPLSSLHSVRPEAVQLLAGSGDYRRFHAENTLFLDTETTGLAGGAGTCVFLVGLGFFEEGEFQILQYFLPSYAAEHCYLQELRKRVVANSRFLYLVSFNGKSYDLNLLDNRFVLQRLEQPFRELEHLDLLHPSRLLWRGSFSDCSLQTLERQLLGLRRHADIPSALIPGVYFDFIRTGRFQLFDQVFEHNRIDLLTLVNLLTIATRVLEDPEAPHPSDRLATARLHEIRGNDSKAESILESVVQDSPKPVPEETLFRLAILKKRLGKKEEALSLFLEMIDWGHGPSVKAHEEAAKILEHDRRDFREALRLVNLALQIRNSPELLHRRHRLRCRLDGVRWF